MPTHANTLASTLELLKGIGELRTRRMFGGTCIYCDDLFIATVHDETLYFEASATTASEFTARGLRQVSYPKDGEAATLQYYEAPQEVFSGRLPMKRSAMLALKAAKLDASRKSGRPSR